MGRLSTQSTYIYDSARLYVGILLIDKWFVFHIIKKCKYYKNYYNVLNLLLIEVEIIMWQQAMAKNP